ncbi:MAG TPA: methyltransferase domain-containing protein [Rhodanobacteraceae bacterium]|nr:methyltransferase domain-containing protein [Rhodanobacteraceae bacterium]
MPQPEPSNRSAGMAVDGNPALTFFREWLRNPFAMAAVSPSGRQLAALMMEQLPDDTQRVIELGGGTGAFTRALLGHGIQPRNLIVVELNEALHHYLHERFHGVQVVRGDARDIRQIARQCGLGGDDVDAVISGLGLLSMSRNSQREILRSAFEVLSPRGRFIQFTYGPFSPVPRELLGELHLKAHRAGTAWRNVPPANVFVYERRRSRRVESVRGSR